MSLRQKTISGLIWTFAEQFAGKGIGFIVQIVLARILMPEEFGLIAMIMVFIGIGNSMVDSGMTSSLIRTVNPDQRDYSTVFFINIIVSFFVYGIIYLSAPAIAAFYEQPILVDLVRVYALIIVIQSFVTVQITRMTKEMNFRIQVIILLPSIIIGGIVGITMALNGWGVWSLVYMALTRTLISTVQYWFYTGWRPDLLIDSKILWKHFNFGYKLTLSGLLFTLFNNIYNIVFGKYFSATEVGYYTKSNELQRFPVVTMATALNKVTYPLFAEIQDDREKLHQVYKKLMKLVLFLTAPLLTLGFVLAEPLFQFILTEKWMPAVPYFRILCLVGLFYPIHSYNLNILKVKGRSDVYLRLTIIKRAITLLGIFILIPYGIFALLYFQVFTNTLSLYINSYYSGYYINYPANKQFKDLLPIILIAIIPGFLVFYLKELLSAVDWASIIIWTATYMLIYLSVHLFLNTTPYTEIKNLIREQLANNKTN